MKRSPMVLCSLADRKPMTPGLSVHVRSSAAERRRSRSRPVAQMRAARPFAIAPRDSRASSEGSSKIRSRRHCNDPR
jgi:hypothetical protein